MASYLLSAFFTSRWIVDIQLALFTAAGALEVRAFPLRRRYAQVILAGGFLVSAPVIVLANHNGGLVGRGVASLWTALLLLAIVIMILRQVLVAEAVTLQSILGAISTYLIIGLMFSAIYGAIYFLHGQHFFADHEPGTSSTFQYFSFTTLTTLGYGDFTSTNSGGRAVAMLEAMTGQIFLATLVAKLVATFRPKSQAAK
ncbi:MAG: potassium channel family protein [Streptosporangiaceae bacterium]